MAEAITKSIYYAKNNSGSFCNGKGKSFCDDAIKDEFFEVYKMLNQKPQFDIVS